MKYSKVLGLDFGEKRIGLAIGDTESSITTPLKTIKNIDYEKSCIEISNVVNEWKISTIVIGIPEINSNQAINKKIKNFGEMLNSSLNLDVVFYNEDYSSNYAQAELKLQMQTGRKKKINKEEIDRIAASLILQSYFENEIFKRSNK